jgi:hypothetical protein
LLFLLSVEHPLTGLFPEPHGAQTVAAVDPQLRFCPHLMVPLSAKDGRVVLCPGPTPLPGLHVTSQLLGWCGVHSRKGSLFLTPQVTWPHH